MNNMKDIRYIQASQSDIAILVDGRIAFSDELNGKQDWVNEQLLRESLTEYFRTELNKTYFSWYAVKEKYIAGIGGIVIKMMPGNMKNISGKWGYIVNIYTAPLYRRQGICTNILVRLQETAQNIGVRALELHATRDGENAYIKQGFLKHPEPTYRKWI